MIPDAVSKIQVNLVLSHPVHAIKSIDDKGRNYLIKLLQWGCSG